MPVIEREKKKIISALEEAVCPLISDVKLKKVIRTPTVNSKKNG